MSVDRERCGMGLFFYPRGGSAKVARYLSRALAPARLGRHAGLRVPRAGRRARSRRAPRSPAWTWSPARYDDAVARWQRGGDPDGRAVPDAPVVRGAPGVPDRAFPWVSPAQGARMATAWASVLAGSEGMSRARLLHLHHLTPLHDAAAAGPARRARRDPPARHRAEDARRASPSGRPELGRPARPLVGRPHARRRAPRRAARSPSRRTTRRGGAPAGARPGDACTASRTASTSTCSRRRSLDADEKREHWLRWLVRDPRGWDEATGVPGQRRATGAGGPRRVLRPRARASRCRCCCSSAASWPSSACRCWSAPTPARARACPCPRRW